MAGGSIIRYTPDLKISNMEALPKGVGAPYLECMTPHDPSLPLIAKAWRRSVPAQYDVLVEFSHYDASPRGKFSASEAKRIAAGGAGAERKYVPAPRRSAASAWRSRIRPEDSRPIELRRDGQGGMSGKDVGDPDREEIDAAVAKWKEQRKGLYDFAHDKDAMEFSIEAAIYYFAADNYGGQGSNLYSVLSMSKYTPGMSEYGLTEENSGLEATDLYEFLTQEFSK